MGQRKIPLNTYKISSPLVAPVLSNHRLTKDSSPNDTRHVVISLEGSSFEYLEGQSVGILPPGADAKGRTHALRLYSMASHRKGEKGYPKNLSICVKRVLYRDSVTGEERRGVASNYICDLKAGDSVSITGPVGNRFLLPERFENDQYVFIATGTGVAPFRGMLIELFQKHFQGEIWLIFGVPYRTDLLYEEEFHSYTAHSNFHFVAAVSREETNPDGSKVYVQHRLWDHRSEIAPLLLKPNTFIYLCGIKGMEKGVDEIFQNMVSRDEFQEVKKRTLVEVY